MKKLLLVLAILGVLVGLTTPALSWPTWTGTATITIATDNNTSSSLSIPRGIKRLGAIIPTVTTGTVAVHVSNDGTTFYAYYYLAGAAAAPAAFVTGSGTHNYATELPEGITAFKYMRFETSAEQTANRTITVFGQE